MHETMTERVERLARIDRLKNQMTGGATEEQPEQNDRSVTARQVRTELFAMEAQDMPHERFHVIVGELVVRIEVVGTIDDAGRVTKFD